MHPGLGLFLLAVAISATCWIIWVTVTLIGVAADLTRHTAKPPEITVSYPDGWCGIAYVETGVIIRALLTYLNVRWEGGGRLTPVEKLKK